MDTPYDLIYYNSLDYFLGSGGGEVYSYIIDFNKHSNLLCPFNYRADVKQYPFSFRKY